MPNEIEARFTYILQAKFGSIQWMNTNVYVQYTRSSSYRTLAGGF